MTAESEMTAIGEQTLVPGVRAVSMRQRLQLRMEAPMLPRHRQRPLDIGLWDAYARNQLDLFGKRP